MDAAGSERAAICGTLEGGPMAALFAATYPERTEALVLYATFARATWAPGYEWAWPAEMRDQNMEKRSSIWGQGYVAAGVAPSQVSDPAFMEWAGRLERLAASPSDHPAHLRADRRVRRARRAARRSACRRS